MNVEIFKHIIVDNRSLLSRIDLISRAFLWDDALNYVLVGPRQAGKSSLIFLKMQELIAQGISEKRLVYINFDDERLIGMNSQDFDLILQAHAQMNSESPILFLDEIQNIPHWENFARRLANEKIKTYITGSNAKMLSSEIASTLGGRYAVKKVFPYSFAEFLNAKNIRYSLDWIFSTEERSRIIQTFNEYFEFGGFPESLIIREKQNWLSTLYQKIFLGDICARYQIRNPEALRLLIKKISESVCQPIAINRLAHVLKSAGYPIQTSTATEYLHYAEESWLIFRIQNYTAKFAEKETIQKHYFTDNGILKLFLIDPKTKLLENLVALTLKKNVPEGKLFFYKKNIEVDFYLPEKKSAIQVCYSLNDDATRKREIRALISLAKTFEITDLKIITFNEEEIINDNEFEIKVVPVWKWILEFK